MCTHTPASQHLTFGEQMCFNKELKMLNQLWEPVQPWNTPLENPRWFGHCYCGDTVVLKRGLAPQIGPYEITVIPLYPSLIWKSWEWFQRPSCFGFLLSNYSMNRIQLLSTLNGTSFENSWWLSDWASCHGDPNAPKPLIIRLINNPLQCKKTHCEQWVKFSLTTVDRCNIVMNVTTCI